MKQRITINAVRHTAAIAMLLLVGIGTAHADRILVDPSAAGSSVVFDFDCDLCSINATLDSNLDDRNLSMAIGDEFTFDFFDIGVGGTTTGTDFTIDATLFLAGPDLSVTATGSGHVYRYVDLAGHHRRTTFSWEQPGSFALGDGSALSLQFADVDVIERNDAIVPVTVRRIEAPVAVPAPGTLALFGIGLPGLAVMTRRRLSPQRA